jgi:hypothetical protein
MEPGPESFESRRSVKSGGRLGGDEPNPASVQWRSSARRGSGAGVFVRGPQRPAAGAGEKAAARGSGSRAGGDGDDVCCCCCEGLLSSFASGDELIRGASNFHFFSFHSFSLVRFHGSNFDMTLILI